MDVGTNEATYLHEIVGPDVAGERENIPGDLIELESCLRRCAQGCDGVGHPQVSYRLSTCLEAAAYSLVQFANSTSHNLSSFSPLPRRLY